MKHSAQNKLHKMVYEETNRCIQCGYCLPACPTYLSMGKESASPRGRINLVKMAAEGKVDVGEHLADPIDLCLGCRACEAACPVDVPYGAILEAAKETIAEVQQNNRGQMSLAGKVSHKLMKHMFPYPNRLRWGGNLLWLAQRMHLDTLARKSGLLRKVYEPLDYFAAAIPKLDAPWKRLVRGGQISVGGKEGTPVHRTRVALFTGCVMDAVMDRTNRLTASLLTAVGCEIVVPNGQACCGALHAHQGLATQALELAQRNIEAFEWSGADYFVNNAGGCGAMLHEYDKLFPVDSEWHTRAQRFVSKSKDISEVLLLFGPLPFRNDWSGTITYQDSCHLRNVQKVSDAPRKLLKSIPGAHFVELEGCEQCCASGGIYNLLHFQESMAILDEKMEKVKQTKATAVVTTNPGCLLQMKIGVQRSEAGDAIQIVHLVEILAEACGFMDE